MNENNISNATQNDIAVSTRVRLARNISGYPFPCKMSKATAQEVSRKVCDAVLSSDELSPYGFKDIDMEKLSDEEAISLVERHVISPVFASERRGRHLLLSRDEHISIMVNEEDHIRIQAVSDGLSLNEAYLKASAVDTALAAKVKFAFSDELGFLTQCPTNLGTGMRASIMLHLPALQRVGAMNRISSNLSKLGFAVRGTYGEGSEAQGAMYQLSNQITLGLSEQTAISNLQNICLQLINRERTAAENISKNIDVTDSIYRSLGILKTARLMSNAEAMEHLSNLRMGIAAGVMKMQNINTDLLNDIIDRIQPATLMKNAGKRMDSQQRDMLRADILRDVLKGE